MTIVRYYNVSDHTMTIPGVTGGLGSQAAATVVADAWDSDPVQAAAQARGVNIGCYAVSLDYVDSGVDLSAQLPYATVEDNTAASSSDPTDRLYIIIADMSVWDLPVAASVAAGWRMRVFFDTGLSGGTLCDITPDGSDTIDTLGDPISMTPTNNYVVFESDGISNWTTL